MGMPWLATGLNDLALTRIADATQARRGLELPASYKSWELTKTNGPERAANSRIQGDIRKSPAPGLFFTQSPGGNSKPPWHARLTSSPTEICIPIQISKQARMRR